MQGAAIVAVRKLKSMPIFSVSQEFFLLDADGHKGRALHN